MAAIENYRVRERLNLPGLGTLKNIEEVRKFLQLLIKSLHIRDKEISNKINQLHVEYVEAAPSGAPDYPFPVIQIEKDGTDYYLHVYTDGGWKTVQLT